MFQPYPFYHRGQELIKITGLLLIVGFLFEYLIVPFQREPSEHLYSYLIITLYHVGVAVLCYFFFFFLLGFLVNDDNWTVGKEFLAVACLLMLIGIGQWAIRPIIYSPNDQLNFTYLVEEVWHTFLSGGLIYFLVTIINLNILAQKNDQRSSHFKNPNIEDEHKQVEIRTAIRSDDFLLDPNNLMCVRADGNYLEFFFIKEDKMVKKVKRITLQSLSQQLSGFTFIMKTHRAYLVNISFITDVKGNAQGYQLAVKGVDFTIPVSRKHLEQFNRAMSIA